MLKTTASDPVVATPESTARAAKAGKKRRRRAGTSKAAPAVPAMGMAAPKATPNAAAMPGVDAFGRVVNWTLFNTTTRNARQAHQTDRANQAQASDITRQNAELAAEAERARTLYHTAGLNRVQACRDGVENVYGAKQRAAQAKAQDRTAEAARAKQQREAAGLARVQGSARPEACDDDAGSGAAAGGSAATSALGGTSGGSL